MSSFLSSSRVDLDSPGTIINDVYYDNKQIVVQDSEVSTHIGRYSQSLTALSFGSTSQIVIPNQDICHEVFIHLELPNIVANQTLARGWGFSAIREVSFTWGQSNVSNLRLSGKSILQLCLESCETKEKRSSVYDLGGQHYGAVTTVNPAATIILPMPWSNNCGLTKKKGFDTSILNNPITIQITLNDANKVGYGSTAALPTALVSGKVFLRQSEFADRSNSLKMALAQNPSLMYQYPLYHKYSPSIKNNIVMDGVTENVLDLQEFINSDLQGIVFSVHNTGLQTTTGTNAPMPSFAAQLKDISLVYNGQTLFQLDGFSAELSNILFSPGATGYDGLIMPQAFPHTATIANDCYIYTIPFGSMKPINFEYKYDNTGRYSSQTFVLRFKALPIAGGATGVGEMHSTYIYSGVAAIQNGICTLEFA